MTYKELALWALQRSNIDIEVDIQLALKVKTDTIKLKPISLGSSPLFMLLETDQLKHRNNVIELILKENKG